MVIKKNDKRFCDIINSLRGKEKVRVLMVCLGNE